MSSICRLYNGIRNTHKTTTLYHFQQVLYIFLASLWQYRVPRAITNVCAANEVRSINVRCTIVGTALRTISIAALCVNPAVAHLKSGVLDTIEYKGTWIIELVRIVNLFDELADEVVRSNVSTIGQLC